MRKLSFAEGEYYHVYNRGNHKQNIFQDERDWIRFLFLLLHLQGAVTINNVSYYVSSFIKHRVFDKTGKLEQKVAQHRMVELVNFTLMPNHFHCTLHALQDDGVSRYMQRILNGYTKYYNTKYDTIGHLFQGPFKSVHVRNNEQLTYLSAYIHRNPHELKQWKGKEHLYPWSSFQDYLDSNRWNLLLRHSIIYDQFVNQKEYYQFVKDLDFDEEDEFYQTPSV